MKLLSYKLRKQQADRTIHKIRNPKTNEIETKLEKIQHCFQEYYKILYSQPQTNDGPQIEAFLSQIHLPKVTEEQNKKLVMKITREEIQLAIGRMKGGKSPGTDGFPTEWYKTMQDQLIPTLLKTFNWILENKTTPPLMEGGSDFDHS